jgi:S1-C subfamily serine protease
MIRFLFGVACLFATPLFSEINPKVIESSCRESVVKLFLFDKEKVEELHLDLEQDGLNVGSGVIVSCEGHIFTSKLLIEKAVNGYLIADWVDDDKVLNRLDILTYVEGMEEDSHVLKVYLKSIASIKVEVFDSRANDYKLLDAKVIAMGSQSDAAVLKIIDPEETNCFKPIMIGDSNRLFWGNSCLVTGFSTPEELQGCKLTKCDGITSYLGMCKETDYYFDPINGMITIDCILPDGLVGSPVIGQEGKVMAIVSKVGFNSSITMAVPVNAFYDVVAKDKELKYKLIKNGLKETKVGFRKFF